MKLQPFTWSRPRNLRKVLWGSLTMITCPCCVPLWIFLLSGTVAGAVLRENIYWAVGLFFIPFLFFAWKAMRSYGAGGNDEGHTGQATRLPS